MILQKNCAFFVHSFVFYATMTISPFTSHNLFKMGEHVLTVSMCSFYTVLVISIMYVI